MKTLKQLVNSLKNSRILWAALSAVAIPIMKRMAVTGKATDKCLANGFLPVPVHFYQPIPDLEAMARRKIWDKVSKLKSIDFDPEKYLKYLTTLARGYAHECVWSNEPSSDSLQFHLHNGCFSYGCAAPLHCIIRQNKPKRIIEVGSGNSSKIIAAAIDANAREHYETAYTIIDPYTVFSPSSFKQDVEVISKPVELMDVDFFACLGVGDILFIDSSHVCKLGSDVNFEILEILPILNTGVYVHFHDINLPYEYPKIYATNPQFRVFWTEAYLLQAFLACNHDFEIILPMDYLQRNYLEKLRESFPGSTQTDFGWVSGSFWIKRVAKTV